SVEILRSNRIGILHDFVLGSQNLDGSLFNTDALAARGRRVGRVVTRVEDAGTLVVLHQQRASARNVIEQPPVVGAHIAANVIGANTKNDGAVAAEVSGCKLGSRHELDIKAKLVEHYRNVISGTHDVADFQRLR